MVVLDAHLCLNNPPQRGGVPIDALTTQGLTLCGNTLGPCGTIYPNISTSQKTYTAGSNVNVQVIINLQHRTPSAPGNISMSYCTNKVCMQDTDFINIPGASIPDPGNITIPASVNITTTLPSNLSAGIVVLRGTYVTNQAITYYICSDVTIQSSNSTNNTSFLYMMLGGKIEVLYVIIGGGGLLLLIVIIIVAVVCVKKRRAASDDYYGNAMDTRRDESAQPIPMMSMTDIQSNLMKTAEEDDGAGYGNNNRGGYNNGNGGYDNRGGYANDNRGGRGGGYTNRY